MTIIDAINLLESDINDSEYDMTDCVEAMQVLIDTGIIYHLQGSYQCIAQGLLDEGLLTMPDVHDRNSPVQYLL